MDRLWRSCGEEAYLAGPGVSAALSRDAGTLLFRTSSPCHNVPC
jgi:hypothetical protein